MGPRLEYFPVLVAVFTKYTTSRVADCKTPSSPDAASLRRECDEEGRWKSEALGGVPGELDGEGGGAERCA